MCFFPANVSGHVEKRENILKLIDFFLNLSSRNVDFHLLFQKSRDEELKTETERQGERDIKRECEISK